MKSPVRGWDTPRQGHTGRALGPFFCCHELLGSIRLGSQDLPPGDYTEILVSPAFLFTSSLAMQHKPDGGSESLAFLNCCPFFVLPGFSGASACVFLHPWHSWLLQLPGFTQSNLVTQICTDLAQIQICLEQSGSLWLLGSLCSFPILMTWALWKTQSKI